MVLLQKLKVFAVIGALAFFGGPLVSMQAQAQVPGLADAIASGDTVTINAIVAANAGDAAVTAQIASTLLAAAQSPALAGSTTGALFAAIAINSGGLTGTASTTALNIVSSSPTALALLTNPNAPNVGGGGAGGVGGSGSGRGGAGGNGSSNPAGNGSQAGACVNPSCT